MKRHISLFAITIALLLGSGALSAVEVQKEPSVKWVQKVQNGFTFELPSDWKTSNYSQPQAPGFCYVGPDEEHRQAIFQCILMETNNNEIKAIHRVKDEGVKVNVAGIPATEYHVVRGPKSEELLILADQPGEDKKSLSIVASSDTGLFSKFEDVFRKVISTLRIAPPEVAQEPQENQSLPFEPSTYKGRTAKVILPWAESSFISLRKLVDGKPAGTWLINANDKEITVPAGRFEIDYYNLPGKLPNGQSFMIIGPEKPHKQIEIKPGSKISIPSAAHFASMIEKNASGTFSSQIEADSLSVQTVLMENGKPSDILMIDSYRPTLAIPADKYQLLAYRIGVKDNGKSWILQWTAQKASVVTIKPNKNLQLKDCQPLTASVVATQKSDQVNMSLKLVDKNGNSASIIPMGGAEPPKFEVISKSGDVVMSGKFEFG